MSIENISVFIITKNEAQNLRRLLPMLSAFPEVVVVDSLSEDATEDVAKSFPNVRFISQPWLGFSAQKDFARQQCRHEWVLNLDADETFDDKIIEDMLSAMGQPDVAGVAFACAEVLHSYRIPHPKTDHRPKLRFFRRDKGAYPAAEVHEKIQLDGKVNRGKAKLYNWGTQIELIIDKQNRYSSLSARESYSKGKRTNIAKLVGKFPFAFVKYYFLKRHFLDGAEGYISAVNYAHYSFQKEAKLYILGKQKPLS